jgi:hypothetical protein
MLINFSYTIIQDLEEYRYIGEGSHAAMGPDLQYRYSRTRAPVELNWVQGVFGED